MGSMDCPKAGDPSARIARAQGARAVFIECPSLREVLYLEVGCGIRASGSIISRPRPPNRLLDAIIGGKLREHYVGVWVWTGIYTHTPLHPYTHTTLPYLPCIVVEHEPDAVDEEGHAGHDG